MKYYPKLHIVEAFQIDRVENEGAYTVVHYDDKTVSMSPEAVVGYFPKVGDYLVVDESGEKTVFAKSEFEKKYQNAENVKAELVSIEDINNKVTGESFGIDGNMIVSFVSLDNGFKTCGHSFCIEDEEFSEGLGKGIAFRNAVERLYEVESYHRMQVAHEVSQACKAFDDA